MHLGEDISFTINMSKGLVFLSTLLQFFVQVCIFSVKIIVKKKAGHNPAKTYQTIVVRTEIGRVASELQRRDFCKSPYYRRIYK